MEPGAVGARSTYVEDDVRVTSARLGGFVVNELVFPASYEMRLDPELGYVAIVLEGAFEKTFVRGERAFSAGSAFTIPAGALHSTRFGRQPTRVVILRPAGHEAAEIPWAGLLLGFRESREAPLGTAWRLSGELRAGDEAWTLAAEALCLELVAGFMRSERSNGTARRARAWLEPVRERLDADLDARPSLAELAASAGVHPVHLARSFRERYGLSIGEYARQLRLDWAAAQLTATETPVALVAAEAGFADQSHFTRAFKQHTGLTPGRYRRAVRE
jgi:AraC family transcriptional regulator